MTYLEKLEQFNQRETWATETSFVCRQIMRDNPAAILDYGAGLGIPQEVAGRAYYRMINFEPNEELRRRAQEKHPNTLMVEGPEQLPYLTMPRIEAVILNHSIAHIEDISDMFFFVRAMCSPCAKIHVVTPSIWFYRWRRPFMTKEQYASDPTVVKDYTPWSLNLLFEENGYRRVRHQMWGDKAFPILGDGSRARMYSVFERKRE